jgi:hypothetical protein
VLSADYLTAPVKKIGKIRSVLTMVGGNVVHAAAPFASLATSLGEASQPASSLRAKRSNPAAK